MAQPDKPFTDAEIRAAWRTLLDSSAGKPAIWDLLKFAGFFDTSYTVMGPGSAEECLFNEGKRRVALRVLGMSGRSDQWIAELTGRDPRAEDKPHVLTDEDPDAGDFSDGGLD